MENRSLISGDERLEGYRTALADNKIPFREALVLRLDLYDIAATVERIRAIWTTSTPTAFIAGGNKITLQLVRVLDGMGLESPRDVSVLGYGDEPWCAFCRPPLTALMMDVDAVSCITVDRMLDKITDRNADRSDIAQTIPQHPHCGQPPLPRYRARIRHHLADDPRASGN